MEIVITKEIIDEIDKILGHSWYGVEFYNDHFCIVLDSNYTDEQLEKLVAYFNKLKGV